MPIKQNKVLAKHEQVEGLLMERIANGEARTGAALPSESRLMRDLKVSRTTVRRAIGNLVRQGVLDSRAGFGHVVRSTESRPVIGIIYKHSLFGADLVPYFSLQLEALQRELERRACTMRVYATELDKSCWDDLEQLQRDARRGRLVGVVGLGWPTGPDDPLALRRRDAELTQLFREVGLPFTALTELDVPAAVALDYEALGFLGTDHFLKRGIREVALMTFTYSRGAYPKRAVKGFLRALEAHGLPFRNDRVLRVGPETESGAYKTFKAWWPRSGHPGALVIDDDSLNKGVMIAALELGVAVPKQLALAALTIKGSRTFYPCPFIPLEIDPDENARVAIDRLLKMIANPEVVPPPLLLEPRIVPQTTKGDTP